MKSALRFEMRLLQESISQAASSVQEGGPIPKQGRLGEPELCFAANCCSAKMTCDSMQAIRLGQRTPP